MRQAVQQLEPDQSVYDIQTMSQRLHTSVAATRFSLMTLMSFAALALALAVVGTYAVFSWLVSRRSAEIGIRMALGARAGQVQRLMLGQTVFLAALGAGLAILGSRLLAGVVLELPVRGNSGQPARARVGNRPARWRCSAGHLGAGTPRGEYRAGHRATRLTAAESGVCWLAVAIEPRPAHDTSPTGR